MHFNFDILIINLKIYEEKNSNNDYINHFCYDRL